MKLVRAYLPVALWMLVIFTASTGAGSVENTSRILGPIIRWFKPDVSPELIFQIQFLVRKAAHFTEFGLLAALTWRARRQSLGERLIWKPVEAMWILFFCFAYAVSDEFHQSFSPTRQASGWDIMIDTFGAGLALMFIRWSCRRAARRGI